MQALLLEKEREIALHARFLADMVNLTETIEDSPGGRSVLIYLLEYLEGKRVETRLYRGPPATQTAYAPLVRKGFLGIRATALISDGAGNGSSTVLAGVAPVERSTGITEVVVATSNLDRAYLEDLKGRIGSDISLIVDGKVAASTLADPECLEALGGLASRFPSGNPKGSDGPLFGRIDCEVAPHRVILSPFEVGFRNAGVVALSVSLVDLLEQTRRIRDYTLTTAAGVLAVVVLVYIWVVRRITRPLQHLSSAVRDVAAGDLSGAIETRAADEIGELGRTFNTMVAQLRESRRQLEEHHRRAMERADRLATIGELASGIAHEIRNPLAGISGAVEIIRTQEQLASGREAMLDEVMKQIRRLETLTRDLLSYSRPADPELAPCAMNDILDSTLFLLEAAQEHVRVTVVKHYGRDLPLVSVDSSQIQQVCLNILLNAVQAMPDGGEIALTTSVTSDDGSRSVTVRIEDQGVGMSPEALRKAVTPFFTTKHRGTGLGLSIAQRIMDCHGGTMEIESTEGQGTRFTLLFPV
jgi:signal transduction histidine kinase